LETVIRIFKYAAKYKWKAIGALFLLILFIAINLTQPMLTKIIIDKVIMGGERALLPWVLVLIVSLSLIKGLMTYSRSYLFEEVSQGCLYDLRNQMYRHLQYLPYSFYDNNRIGELMSRMTGDLEGIRMLLIVGAPILLENGIYFFGSIIILFSMSAKLAIACFCLSPLLAWGAFRYDKVIRPMFSEIREQHAHLNTAAQENISGVRVVKAFAREDYEIKKFEKENAATRDMNIKLSGLTARFFPTMDFLSGLSAVILIVYGGWMVANGTISLGTLTAFNGYAWMLIQPMRMLGWMINVLAQAVASGQRVFNVLDTGSELREPEEPYSPDEVRGDVKFEDVCFYYREQEVLHNINFDAPAGKTIAIMGETGSGKTSIINLIGRFYDVYSGRVLVDGVDVRQWDLEKLRSMIGIVMQETFLFSDTIEGNILYGNPDASHEEVVRAAKIAHAHDFIMEMPDGYNTIVGERGMGLSGGQKQRIAIARAIVKNPRILIMDDCTSAVDMETEAEIQSALKDVMKNRTTFIIAHRISSVKNADEILVLDKGRIVERGTHQELVAKKGRYYEIYRQQYKDLDDQTLGLVADERTVMQHA